LQAYEAVLLRWGLPGSLPIRPRAPPTGPGHLACGVACAAYAVQRAIAIFYTPLHAVSHHASLQYPHILVQFRQLCPAHWQTQPAARKHMDVPSNMPAVQAATLCWSPAHTHCHR
jgi:hypothetical protein